MQPCNFIVIQDAATKARIKEIFLRENEKAAANYSGARGTLYRSLKLEGIEEAPVNLCVTADRTRSGPHVLGRNTIVDTDLYSTCCAIVYEACSGLNESPNPGRSGIRTG
jgi:5,6-dimethylbenzimidazole synthase